MAHRSARGALRERREEILERLAVLEVKDDADDERGALLKELDQVRSSLELITPPRSVLKRLRIVRGCDMPWSSMMGGARVRHCGACDREVYDLTAMDPDEVEAFVEARQHDLPCMQMHARPDGRYQDGPCAPAQRRNLVRACGAAMTLGLVALTAMLSTESSPVVQPAPAPDPNARFDAHAFLDPVPAPSPWPAPAFDVMRMGGAMGLAPVTLQTAALDALEDTLWSDPRVVRAARDAGGGFVTLHVNVDGQGGISTTVAHTSPGVCVCRLARGQRRQ